MMIMMVPMTGMT